VKKLILKILGKILYLGAFAALFGFSIFVTQGYRYNFQDNEIIRTGVVDICVMPKKSEVTVDGKLYDDQSCIKLYDLSVGPHRLEVRKMGYYSWVKDLMVDREKASVFPPIMLIPLPDFWNRTVLEKGVKKVWVSPNESRFVVYAPKLNVIKIFSSTQSEPIILEVPAAVTDLTWIDNKHLVADTKMGRFENHIDVNEWAAVTDLVLHPFEETSQLIVEGNEIWRKDTADNTFITRYAEPIESADFFYNYSNLLIATADEIKLCDSEAQNCQKIADKDPGTPVANPFHSKKIVFVENGNLTQITLNSPAEDLPEINI